MLPAEKANFFAKVLPHIQWLCQITREVVTCPLPVLKKYKNQSLSLSQNQLSCLLANAFLCTFPKPLSDEEEFPTINFSEYDSLTGILFSDWVGLNCVTLNSHRLFEYEDNDRVDSRIGSKAHKIYCVLHYFSRILESGKIK